MHDAAHRDSEPLEIRMLALGHLLIRSIVCSFACYPLLALFARSAALTCSLARSLIPLWAHGTVEYFFPIFKVFWIIGPQENDIIYLIICRCAAASLQEDVSVRPSAGPSETPSLSDVLANIGLVFVSTEWMIIFLQTVTFRATPSPSTSTSTFDKDSHFSEDDRHHMLDEKYNIFKVSSPTLFFFISTP